jgi:hypothetical protein
LSDNHGYSSDLEFELTIGVGREGINRDPAGERGVIEEPAHLSRVAVVGPGVAASFGVDEAVDPEVPEV